MLRSAPKSDLSQAAPVTPMEDARLRAAFGRYGGGPLERHDAALVVADHQQRGPGGWFLCDCRPDADLPPVLVPVSMTHIRRHEDARWPPHDEACDFFREPAEQRAIVASHSASVARPFRLARRINPFTPELRHDIAACSPHGRRPGLARLLARLVTDAGLQRIGTGWRKPTLGEQAKAIWAAARPIEIDAGEERFQGTRPHGILIARASAIADGLLSRSPASPFRSGGASPCSASGPGPSGSIARSARRGLHGWSRASLAGPAPRSRSRRCRPMRIHVRTMRI